jgi:putative phage-type endonuclease
MQNNNIVYLKDLDLEDLEDVSGTLFFHTEEEPSIFSDFEEEFIETCLLLMEEYLKENPSFISDPDFCEYLREEMEELFFIQLEDEFNWINQAEEEDKLSELLDFAFDLFFSIFIQERSTTTTSAETNTNTSTELDKNKLLKKIQNLKSKPQPVQRTKEWYEFRYNLITASNAYKAFESQAMQNQLIYEKCLPLKTVDQDKQSSMVNTNSTLHWGQKYEPLSVLLYEEIFQTNVDDFGCIQHEKYSFLGASPDGINMNPTSDRFGRMLEIKNIVNREINGIPKKEYWIQMQLQMEVCDLEECDFLETKFVEYENAETFYKEKEKDDVNSIAFPFPFKSGLELKQGIILYFNTKDSKPFYVYKPLNIISADKIEEWEEWMVDKYESEEFQMVFIKNIYWKLEKFSCVLVQRNKNWFENNIGQLENIWKIIEKERITGFQHRAPNKKQKNDSNQNITTFFKKEDGCLINLNKISCGKEKLFINKLDFKEDFKQDLDLNVNVDLNISTKDSNNTKIIKVDLDLFSTNHDKN